MFDYLGMSFGDLLDLQSIGDDWFSFVMSMVFVLTSLDVLVAYILKSDTIVGTVLDISNDHCIHTFVDFLVVWVGCALVHCILAFVVMLVILSLEPLPVYVVIMLFAPLVAALVVTLFRVVGGR